MRNKAVSFIYSCNFDDLLAIRQILYAYSMYVFYVINIASLRFLLLIYDFNLFVANGFQDVLRSNNFLNVRV